MNKLIRVIPILAITIFSCEGTEEPIVTVLTGDLVGRVGAVMDEFGNLISDRSGYEVKLEGTSPEKTAVTEASGKFFIEGLTSGTYNLIFSKPGFQTWKVFSYQFTGGVVPTYYEAPLLSQLSSTSITSFNAFVTNENNPDTTKYTMVKIEFEINPSDSKPRTVVTYLGSSPDVSSVDYAYQLNDPGSYKFNKSPSGTKLYAVAYPAPTACNAYYDPEKNLFINSCLGEPTPVVEFVVP